MSASARQQWKAISRAGRTRRRAVHGLGMYLAARPAALPDERGRQEEAAAAVEYARLSGLPLPPGSDDAQTQTAAFLARAASRRRVLREIRGLRAELARRATERVAYALAGEEVPRYIETDALLGHRAAGIRSRHLANVRGTPHPLDHLHDIEQNLRVVLALRIPAAAV